MGRIRDAFNSAWIDGPASASNHPDKAEIRRVGGTLEDAIVSAAEGYTVAISWSALNNIQGVKSGQPARINSNVSGTHVDPVTGDTVPNAGEYIWSISPQGWRRVGDVLDAPALKGALDGKAALSDLEEEVDRATAAEQEIARDAGNLNYLLDTTYSGGVIAEDEETVLIGYRPDGTVDVSNTYPLLDPKWVWAVVNEDLEILSAWDGADEFYPASSAPLESQAAWVAGGEVVVVVDGQRAAITYDTPPGTTNSNATIKGDFARYVVDDGVKVTFAEEYLKATTQLSSTVDHLVHYLLYGQSLSVGTGGSPIAHTTAFRAGRAAMFNGGIADRGTVPVEYPVPAANRYSLVDARETGTTESPGAGLVWKATDSGGLAANEAGLVTTAGRGAQSYGELKKGGNGVQWENLIGAYRRGRVVAALNGLSYEVGALHWIQGENDRLATKATYKGYLAQLQQDASDDMGQEIVVVLDQISNWTSYGIATSQVPFAQLEVAIDQPTKFVCVGPKYFLPSGDGTHLASAAAYARLGSYHGRAINRFRAGLDALPLYCVSVSRAAGVIRLAMHVPVGPLVLDTAAVSNPGNYGITWSQTGGTARTIASVAIEGNDIVVTLSGDPVSFSSASIGIAASGTSGAGAGPTTGARSNFRDSASDLDIDGNQMPNWACHQLIAIS